MVIEGGCYCGDVRYRAEGEPLFAGQCHCRECQYITGGNPNVMMGMPESGCSFSGTPPKAFSRPDLDSAVTRLFCENCGTAIGSKSPNAPGIVILKVGTMDDPSVFTPQMAIYTVDSQSFHHVPDDIPSFDRLPG